MTMNRATLKRVLPQWMAWAGLFLLCAAAAVAQGTAPAQRTDGQIEMDVVQALDAAPTLKNDLITAATIQSEVTLSGTVSSDASRQLAESIANKVPGVTKVHNNLKVGNPQQAQDQMDQSDADAGEPPVPDDQQAPGQPQGQYPAQPQYPQQEQYPPQQGQYPPQQGQYPQQPPYPQQGQYPPPYPPARPQYPGQGQPYQQPYPQQPSYQFAKGPVTIPSGTLLQLRTSEPVSSKRAADGTPVQFTVIQDVTFGGVLAIPRGAVVHGVVTESKRVGSGQLGGSPELALTLTSLDLGGQTYPLQSDAFKVKGPNKAGRTANNAIGGALLGAIIGGAVGRGPGAAIGAAAGAGAGTAASAASSGPDAWIPAEALVTFHLAAPVTVNPVSPEEAARLAQGLYPGGPTLYRRRYPGYGPAYYAYPPVYYRPYYMVGGFYYWR